MEKAWGYLWESPWAFPWAFRSDWASGYWS